MNDLDKQQATLHLATSQGAQDGRRDPLGNKGPSRATAREHIGNDYDDGAIYDAYAQAYRDASALCYRLCLGK